MDSITEINNRITQTNKIEEPFTICFDFPITDIAEDSVIETTIFKVVAREYEVFFDEVWIKADFSIWNPLGGATNLVSPWLYYLKTVKQFILPMVTGLPWMNNTEMFTDKIDRWMRPSNRWIQTIPYPFKLIKGDEVKLGLYRISGGHYKYLESLIFKIKGHKERISR